MIYFISKGSVFESGVPAEMREAWRVSNSPSPVWLTVRATAPLGADQVALYLGADECNPGAKAIFDSLEFKSFPVGVPRGELGLQPNLWTADPGRDPVARTWDPERFPSLRATSGPRSLNLLDRIAHVPAERNQVRSGTCGVWALTALVELEMARKYGIKDRLSVQYYESNKDRSFYPKSEDLFSDFANFYKFSKILIPWANPNAEFRSTHGFEEKIEHHTPVIGDPHYKLLDLEFGELFEPSSMHDHTATIEAIKKYILEKGSIEIIEWIPPMWVSCHGSVILGYNQESEDPSEHYWIVLNSWGSIGKMKNSTYWLPMNINYSEKVELPTEFDNKGEMLRPARKSHRYLFYVVKKLELDLRPTVVSPPEILLATTEPRAGETLKLMASVVCTPPVTYQWFRNGLRLAGATQSVLVIPEATPDASGSYTVEATHSTGSVMSAVTTVTVNAPRKVESKTGDGRP